MTAIVEEPTRTEQKTITKVAGIVDLADGRGFLRTGGYRRDANDIPITQAQVRQHALRSGDHITGTRQPSQGKEAKETRQEARPAKTRPCSPSTPSTAARRPKPRTARASTT